MENKLNWLAYESGVLTERFQTWHLIVNYSILAVTLVLYLVGIVGTLAISLAAVPGALIFLVSVQALSWKHAVEGETLSLPFWTV